MFYIKTSLFNIIASSVLVLACLVTKFSPAMIKTPVNLIGKEKADTTGDHQLLESLLKRYPQYFDAVLKNKAALNVQLIYTQVDHTAKGIPTLINHYFNVDESNYFYPASTIKLPIVMLALQKLNELKDKGIDMNSTMITETAFNGQTAVYNDPTTHDGKPSIANYIKKILLVSDNDAYNRLYEFLGQDYINRTMYQKGYKTAQILHRLDIFLSEDENRHTNPVKFYDQNNRLLYEQPAQYSKIKYITRNDSIGMGFWKGGKLVKGPMNFSAKNSIKLGDLHQILRSLVFPESVPNSQQFKLTKIDKEFIMKYMSQLPTESNIPPYAADTIQYWPAYGKFLLYGAEQGKLPENIRIFNKEGDAYGHLLDIAYFADFENKIDFFISAVIYCNSDGILNDDQYDYKTIGLPFMKNLGKVIYEYELKRDRPVKPDLSPFKFKYDK